MFGFNAGSVVPPKTGFNWIPPKMMDDNLYCFVQTISSLKSDDSQRREVSFVVKDTFTIDQLCDALLATVGYTYVHPPVMDVGFEPWKRELSVWRTMEGANIIGAGYWFWIRKRGEKIRVSYEKTTIHALKGRIVWMTVCREKGKLISPKDLQQVKLRSTKPTRYSDPHAYRLGSIISITYEAEFLNPELDYFTEQHEEIFEIIDARIGRSEKSSIRFSQYLIENHNPNNIVDWQVWIMCENGHWSVLNVEKWNVRILDVTLVKSK